MNCDRRYEKKYLGQEQLTSEGLSCLPRGSGVWSECAGPSLGGGGCEDHLGQQVLTGEGPEPGFSIPRLHSVPSLRPWEHGPAAGGRKPAGAGGQGRPHRLGGAFCLYHTEKPGKG